MLNCPSDDKVVKQLGLHVESGDTSVAKADRDVGYFINNMAPNIAEQNYR